MEVKSYTKFHIDAVISEASSDYRWRITSFYGHPETHKRYESWHLLAFLNNQLQLPWLCLGDFNEILSMNENFGGANRPQQRMDGFREIVNYCGFHDLGYCGPDYTWSNMQEGENRICLRLDRALATLEWSARFERMKVYHLVDSTSDHYALLVTDSRARHRPRVRRFHFEAHWVKREDCKSIIEASWGFGVDLSTPKGIAENLRICAADLSRWNSTVYGQIPKKIQDKRNRLNALPIHEKEEDLSLEINRLRRELNDLLDDEEMCWGQRAKAHWLKKGERNTKFFHAQASKRRKQNTIVGI